MERILKEQDECYTIVWRLSTSKTLRLFPKKVSDRCIKINFTVNLSGSTNLKTNRFK